MVLIQSAAGAEIDDEKTGVKIDDDDKEEEEEVGEEEHPTTTPPHTGGAEPGADGAAGAAAAAAAYDEEPDGGVLKGSDFPYERAAVDIDDEKTGGAEPGADGAAGAASPAHTEPGYYEEPGGTQGPRGLTARGITAAAAD